MYLDMGEPYRGGTTNIRFIMGSVTCTTSNILSAATWTYVVISYDGTQPTNMSKVTVYSNGVAQTMAQGGGAIRLTINIADLHHQFGKFAGLLDELRLSNSLRSPDWITTEYNNQSSPASFLSVGPNSNARIIVSHVSRRNVLGRRRRYSVRKKPWSRPCASP